MHCVHKIIVMHVASWQHNNCFCSVAKTSQQLSLRTLHWKVRGNFADCSLACVWLLLLYQQKRTRNDVYTYYVNIWMDQIRMGINLLVILFSNITLKCILRLQICQQNTSQSFGITTRYKFHSINL